MKVKLLLPTEVTCGYFDCSSFAPSKESPPRKCETFEVEFFLADGENTYINDVAYPIRRNYALISIPGEMRYSVLPFKTKYVKFSVAGMLAEALRKAPRYFYVSQSIEANVLLDEIITTYTLRQEDEIRLQGKLLIYISLLLKNAEEPSRTGSDQTGIIVKAQEYIKGHYKESVQLCDIAKSVNLSPNYFHTVFSQGCGQTPREYLEEYRIGIAKKFLLTTQLSLSELAEQCGFSNQQYLTTVFKRKVGCSPTQFKRRHQSAYFD